MTVLPESRREEEGQPSRTVATHTLLYSPSPTAENRAPRSIIGGHSFVDSRVSTSVLYVTPHQVWPINSGGALRDYYLARRLAARFSVTVVDMRHDRATSEFPPNDAGFAQFFTLQKGRTYSVRRVMRGMTGSKPVTVLNCWSSRAASELEAILRSRHFDTVQIEGVNLAEYLPIMRRAPSRPAIVFDWHNIESELMSRYATTTSNWAKKLVAIRTARQIERAECELLETCATHTVASERERQKLLAWCPGASIHVIPNGVDSEFYSASKIVEAGHHMGLPDSKRSLLFVGSMDYHANIDAVMWFLQTVWPEIARNHPGLQFVIVGRDPPLKIRALASPRIRVTGTVDDVRPFYASAVSVVVPIRSGSGTRLKILEAMAAGVPVVSTQLGAEGIDAEHGIHLFLADRSRDFAAAVSHLVSCAETRVRLSAAARALAVAKYDWSTIGDQLCRIHFELAQEQRPNHS